MAPNAESQHKASVGTQVAYQTVDGHDDRNESANFSWIFLRVSNIGRANINTNTANFSWIFSNIGIWKANTNTANFSWIFLEIQYWKANTNTANLGHSVLEKAGAFGESCSLIAARFSTL